MRVSVSSQSLNWLLGTFQAPNRSVIQQPVNTLSPPQAAETGVYNATFENQVRNGMPRTFHNSIYFLRNGSKIQTSKWHIDQQEYVSRDLYDVYNEDTGRNSENQTQVYILVFHLYTTFKRHFTLMY